MEPNCRCCPTKARFSNGEWRLDFSVERGSDNNKTKEALMDSKLLMQTATALLAVTALGGLLMAFLRFSGADRPPSWLAMLHGLLAASGLTLLLFAGFAYGIPSMVWIGIGLLVLAAIGGAYLNLGFHDKRLPLPKPIVIGHALVAVAGFALVFLGMG